MITIFTNVYPCLLVFTLFLPLLAHVILCLTLFTCACFPMLPRFNYVYLWLHLFTRVYLCLPMFTRVSVCTCLPMFNTDYSCLMFSFVYHSTRASLVMSTHLYSWLPIFALFTYICHRLLIFTYVHPFYSSLPMFSHVYQRLFVFNYVSNSLLAFT